MPNKFVHDALALTIQERDYLEALSNGAGIRDIALLTGGEEEATSRLEECADRNNCDSLYQLVYRFGVEMGRYHAD